ncbi:hypothetical protein K4A83_09905 [Spirulina subsalsa FACHB-351]|uniref:Uncharacterized protein n=1 Tax=Spirulina subsalsa FACHB-351 TaxID=234711 RepID=A0ABT3L4X9_9CYAN|nr:hypothetical protein [Spirulina subsalsa]MCW6036573.1 hypothetical protein [Spirulina subsalsa FACHB-351]
MTIFSASVWFKFQKWLQTPQGNDFSLIFLTGAIAFLTFLSPDKINVGDGFGWDGSRYAELAQNFYQRFAQGIDNYYISRILPSFLIFHTLQFFRLEHSNSNIIHSFGLLNALLITLSMYFWCLIAQQLQISSQGKWIGFIAFILNCFILKITPYYPVLTDVAAYSISMAMFYAYLSRRTFLLMGLIAIGTFSWSNLYYFGATLLLFPAPETPNYKLPTTAKSALLTAGALTLAAVVYMVILAHSGREIRAEWQIAPLLHSTVYLSIALSASYLFFGLFYLLKSSSFFNLKSWFSPFNYITLAGKVSFLFFLNTLAQSLVTEPGNTLSFGLLLEFVVWTSIIQPATFFVSHVMYFGLIVWFLVFYWSKITQLINQQGLGLSLCVFIGIILSLASESRYLVNIIPLVFPFAIKILDQQQWTIKQMVGFFLASLLFSKVWLTIGELSGDYGEFPMQRYFMNVGPWMYHPMYIAQGVAVALAGVGLYYFYVSKSSHHTP